MTHGPEGSGGVRRWTEFLYSAFEHSDRFELDVVSIATSSRDSNSRRILKPSTWWRPVVESRGSFRGIDYRHVGANLVELEFQRYRPRPLLTRVLAEYDLIQFVVGFASWGYVASQQAAPIVLLVATTALADRRARVEASRFPRRWWLASMGLIAERYERRALRRADRTIVPSEYTLGAVRPWTGPDRARVVFPGVDTDRLRPGTGITRQGILTVGRFDDPRKNLALLLRAYSRLPPSLGQPLRVVGETPDHLKDLARRLGISDRVEFVGRVENFEKLCDLYASAAVLAVSSDEEGLSMVIQEAMAAGLPVVSTDCGGPRTIVRDGVTGRLTPVGDEQALADAMRATLDDPVMMQRMGASARAFAEEHFTLERSARAFAATWEVALSGGSGHGSAAVRSGQRGPA